MKEYNTTCLLERTITSHFYNYAGSLALPFHRYWNSAIGDHFYTLNPTEIGTTTPGQIGEHGYTSEGVQCKIFARPVAGTVRLYRYWLAGNRGDHFYTLNQSEIGTTTPGMTGNFGYVSEADGFSSVPGITEGVAGYCYPGPVEGLAIEAIPLYRYYNGGSNDHFYTTDAEEIGTTVSGTVGKGGYTSEGIVCYVLPSNFAQC